MGAPTQYGTSVIIGFGNFAISGYIPMDGLRWKKTMQEKRVIKDTNALTVTKIMADAADEFEMDLIPLTSGGTIVPVAEGAKVSITDPNNTTVNCQLVSGVVDFGRLEDKVTMSLIKEGSMTYT